VHRSDKECPWHDGRPLPASPGARAHLLGTLNNPQSDSPAFPVQLRPSGRHQATDPRTRTTYRGLMRSRSRAGGTPKARRRGDATQPASGLTTRSPAKKRNSTPHAGPVPGAYSPISVTPGAWRTALLTSSPAATMICLRPRHNHPLVPQDGERWCGWMSDSRPLAARGNRLVARHKDAHTSPAVTAIVRELTKLPSGRQPHPATGLKPSHLLWAERGWGPVT